jgi:DNA-binding NtrC family response regulator
VKAQPKPRGRGRRVLCIEDERIVRVFSSSALETVGYEVASAATGAEAARIFRKATPPFDLIVCDMVLPDAHGLDLVRAFLKVQPDLRVIMATGYTDDPTAREKVESEGHRFLAKPYSSSDLTRAAAAVLDDDEAENAA